MAVLRCMFDDVRGIVSTRCAFKWGRGQCSKWMKHGQVVLGCHATAGQEYLARWPGVSRQNGLAAPCINAYLCVVPPYLQVLRRQPCVRVVVPTYTLLHGEGVREQGLCFHGLALLFGEGSAKHTGYVEGLWVLGTECAPGLGKCTP